MATFYQRNNNSWQVKIRRKSGISISKTFSTISNAKAWARKEESAIERGLWRDTTLAESTTIFQALERYKTISEKKKGRIKEASMIRILQDEAIAKLSLARISSANITKMITNWEKYGLSPSTINRRLLLLSHVFTIARKEWGIFVENPVSLVRKPKISNSRDIILTNDEIDQICKNNQSPYLTDIVIIAVETAMRLSEIVSMNWKNINLDKKIFMVEDSKNNTRRGVPLSSRVVEILRIRKSNIRRLDGRVFPITTGSITLAWIRACKRCNIKNKRFHDLRHTATTNLGKIFNIQDLAKITGHKDTRMLLRYYNPNAEDLAKKLL